MNQLLIAIGAGIAAIGALSKSETETEKVDKAKTVPDNQDSNSIDMGVNSNVETNENDSSNTLAESSE